MKKALILSDSKIGHLNQSIAFCEIENLKYEIVEVNFKSKFYKVLSYLFDKFNLYFEFLLNLNYIKNNYDVIISTGSETYYANKLLSKKLNLKSIAIMLPKGYKLNFDYIIAQTHDTPPKRTNIIEIPINLSIPKVINDFNPNQKAISLIIGGDNSVFKMNIDEVKSVIDFIFQKFPNHIKAITTSRRTPKEIEKLIENYNFDYNVIYSQNKINPIGDFLAKSEYVFITSDSTSMISEAVSFGKSFVEIIKLSEKKPNSKFIKLINNLEDNKNLHIFNGNIKLRGKKIDLKTLLNQFI